MSNFAGPKCTFGRSDFFARKTNLPYFPPSGLSSLFELPLEMSYSVGVHSRTHLFGPRPRCLSSICLQFLFLSLFTWRGGANGREREKTGKGRKEDPYVKEEETTNASMNAAVGATAVGATAVGATAGKEKERRESRLPERAPGRGRAGTAGRTTRARLEQRRNENEG